MYVINAINNLLTVSWKNYYFLLFYVACLETIAAMIQAKIDSKYFTENISFSFATRVLANFSLQYVWPVSHFIISD